MTTFFYRISMATGYRLLLFVCFFFVTLPLFTLAQENQGYKTITLSSQALGKQVTLLVAGEEVVQQQQAYPVLMVWGEGSFGLAAEMVKEYSRQGHMPQTLVVGLEGIAASDFADQLPAFTGQTEVPPLKTTTFLQEELLPWLQENYPGHTNRMLAGHRDFGLLTLLTLFQQPELFRAYFCFSPPAYQLGDFEGAFRRFLVGNWHWNTGLYISIGFGDAPRMRETLELCRLLNSHDIERPVDYKFEMIQAQSNRSLVPESLSSALSHYFEPYRLGILLPYNSPETLPRLKKELQAKYGYDPLQLQVPRIPAGRALLPTAMEQPQRLAAHYNWLATDPDQPYKADLPELLNLYHYLEQQEKTEALDPLKQLMREHFGQRRVPAWQQVEHANNYSASVDLQHGLVLHPDFTSQGQDRSPQKQQVVVHNTVFEKDGRFEAAVFNGKDTRLEVPFAPSLDFTRSFSFSGWVKAERVLRFEAFIEQADSGSRRSQWRVGFGPMAGFQWGLSAWNNAWKDYVINREFPRDEWVHMAVVADQSLGHVTCYFNGEEAGQVDQVFPFSPTEKPVLIGCKANGDHFQGKLAGVRLYNRALSPAEVQALYGLQE